MKTKINQKHQNQGGQKKDKQMMKKDKQKKHQNQGG